MSHKGWRIVISKYQFQCQPNNRYRTQPERYGFEVRKQRLILILMNHNRPISMPNGTGHLMQSHRILMSQLRWWSGRWIWHASRNREYQWFPLISVCHRGLEHLALKQEHATVEPATTAVPLYRDRVANAYYRLFSSPPPHVQITRDCDMCVLIAFIE